MLVKDQIQIILILNNITNLLNLIYNLIKNKMIEDLLKIENNHTLKQSPEIMNKCEVHMEILLMKKEIL
jgi:signal transduction histidine kinase